jgi:hypothetical protein
MGIESYPWAKLLKIIQYLLLRLVCFGDDVVKDYLMITCIDLFTRRIVWPV